MLFSSSAFLMKCKSVVGFAVQNGEELVIINSINNLIHKYTPCPEHRDDLNDIKMQMSDPGEKKFKPNASYYH